MLAGGAESPRTDQDYMAWEIFGNRAVRQGDWKLRWQWKPWGKGDWELFNLAAGSRRSGKNVAADNPEKLKALLARWDEYVKANNVIIPSRSVFESSDDKMPPRFPDDAGIPAAHLHEAVRSAARTDQALTEAAMTHALEPKEHPVKSTPFVTRVGGWQRGAVALAVVALLVPALARAQGDGPRSYWKGLSGTNVVPVIYTTVSGNTNPFDPSHTVLADSNFDATLMLAGYAKATRPVGDRAATVSVLFPMGSLSGQAVVDGKTVGQSAGGFGDPMLQFGLNLVGPKAMKNIPDVLRYEPGFSIDVIGSLAVPIGEYNNDPAAQHRPEPLVRADWRAGRLADSAAGRRSAGRRSSSCRRSGSSAPTTTSSARR